MFAKRCGPIAPVTGSWEISDVPKSPNHGAGEPLEVPNEGRAVEAELLAKRPHVFFRRTLTQHRLGDVAREQLHRPENQDTEITKSVSNPSPSRLSTMFRTSPMSPLPCCLRIAGASFADRSTLGLGHLPPSSSGSPEWGPRTRKSQTDGR